MEMPTAERDLVSSASSLPGSTVDWGRVEYGEAVRRQEALVAARIAGEAPDTLVFVEHDPVYTVGRRVGAAGHLVWGEEERARRGIAFSETARGGDVTYHGPGQIVGYPIVSLAASRDLHGYLRQLEEVLIRAVGRLGLAAHRRDGKTGIWCETRKVAAIGVAVRRWVTWHGFALNVDPDLTHYAGIVPCGIVDGTITSLAAELGTAPPAAEVKRALALEFWDLFPNPS